MKLDILTLVTMLSVSNFIQVIAMFIQYLVNKVYQGIGLWVLGFASMSMGYVLIFMRDTVSVKIITIILANSLILSGPVFLYVGVMRFLEKKENRGIIVTLFTAFLISYFYYTYYNDDIKVRTGIIYSAVAVFTFLTAHGLFLYRKRSIRTMAYFNATLFIIQGCFFSFRALAALISDPLNSVFSPTVMQTASFLFLFVEGILVTFGLIVMVNQRLNAEMREAKDHFELIFDTSPDSVVITRLDDGRFVNINSSFVALTGLTRAEISGKSSLEINFWKDPDERTRFINKLIENGFCENEEVTFIRKDGSLIDGLLSARIIQIHDVPHIISVARDISQRKQAEEALRESELKYRLFVENTSDVVFCVNEKGEYQFANKVFASTFDKTPDYFTGKTFWDIYPDEHADHRQEANKKVFETGEIQSIEVTVPLPDRTLYYLAKANPIKDETGKIILNLTTATDITDRKRAEEALLAKSEELERYFTSSLDLLCIASTEGFFVRLNPEWERVLGYSIHDLEGRSFLDFVHPDDMEGTLSEMSKLEAQEKVLSFENRYRGKDGSYRWIEWRSHSQGKLIYAAARDVTDRKKAEEALRDSEEKLSTLFGSMTEMVVLHDLVFNEQGEAVNYIITDCNNAFTEITGIKKDYAVGKPATEVFRTEFAPYLDDYSRVAITGLPFEYNTYFEPLDKYFSVSAVSPKKNSFATITTDITGVRKIQEIVSAKNKELENYLYVASHDLRSPLVNIQGFSRRLQKQVDSVKSLLSGCSLMPEEKNAAAEITDELIPKTLNFIFSSVAKMDSLLNGLLYVSRTGRTLMTIKEIDINKLFKTIISTYNFQLTELDAVVEVDELPLCYGDENLLNQLFSNIIGNSIRYRDKSRKLLIEIAGRHEFKKVIYSIRDNGKGIDARHLEKIWDLFYRVDSKQPDAGEGLGLSIVKRIAEKHDGRVWVESQPGAGSVFFIELQRYEFSEQ